MTASRLARRLLPSPESLEQTKGLKWLGLYLKERPWLWVAHRRRVALGAGLGLALYVIVYIGWWAVIRYERRRRLRERAMRT